MYIRLNTIGYYVHHKQGQIQDYGKRGHKGIEYGRSNAHTVARGVWGHAPRKFLSFRCSEIDSCAFWDTFPRQVSKPTNLDLSNLI